MGNTELNVEGLDPVGEGRGQIDVREEVKLELKPEEEPASGHVPVS